MLAYLKKHGGAYAAVLIPVLAFELPALTAYHSAHPDTFAGVVTGVAITLYHILRGNQ